MNFIKPLLLLPAGILIAVFLSYTSTKTLYNPSSSLDELIFISRDYFARDDAVVNILCHTTNTDYKTATGVLIDPRGYILSNAHVAADMTRPIVCSVGRGSPATEFGDISLIFIPTSYTLANTEAEKTLHDISIWKIRGSNYNLPYIKLKTDTAIKSGDSLTAISYPSDGLLANNLDLVISDAIVKNADDYVIEARTKLNARLGSSGGILADTQTGELRGLIFGINTKTSTVYALTPLAINTTIKKETNLTLREWLKLPELSGK